MTNIRFVLLSVFITGIPLFQTSANNWEVEVEGGAVWFSRNDTRIPGDTGTQFNMLDLTGDGPDANVRLMTTYKFNEKHALRLTLAPLETKGTGTLSQDTVFEDEVFAPDVPTKGTYRFNTYRLTYRWTFHDSDQWLWAVGAAALVRDAEISLEQGDLSQSKDDLGVVPLISLFGQYRFCEEASLILDIEGLAGGPGRAVDAALKVRWDFDEDWFATVGYRTIEGGSDVDEVYTFSWLHLAQLSAGVQF